MGDATSEKKTPTTLDIIRGKCAHKPLMRAIGRTLPFPRASPDPDTSGRATHLSASPGARPLPGGGTPTAVLRQKTKRGGWDAASHNKPNLRSSTGFTASDATEPTDPGVFFSARRPLDEPTATPALGVAPEGFSRLQPERGAIPAGSSVPVSRGASVLDADFFFPSPKTRSLDARAQFEPGKTYHTQPAPPAVQTGNSRHTKKKRGRNRFVRGMTSK